MKKHGFTLIELIVVIAIVGVLAAILVPAMMGYVKRSKITTANSASKEIFNALNAAVVEMSQLDAPTTRLIGDYQTTGAAIYAQHNRGVSMSSNPTVAELTEVLYGKVSNYFSDVASIDTISIRMNSDGCEGVGVVNKRYPGSYPIAVTVEIYDDYAGNWVSDTALGLAVSDSTLYADADPTPGG